MSQTKAQLVSGTTSQDLTVDNINTSSINSGKTSGRKNLIINGAFNIAQRGATSTVNGYGCLDRFRTYFQGTDEAPTQAQVDVASGTTPYTQGFRKAFKLTNGNQTGGAGTSDAIQIQTSLEAQDMATSGWNYTSSSSFVTLSFWIKSSVAQNFYFYLRSNDGTTQSYPFETGSLSADTWTKITKTIPGNTNIQFDNDINAGLQLFIVAFYGTDFTDSGVTLNQWGPYTSGARMPDFTSTWYTTNDSTFEITGIQLEVGSTATDFEHMIFSEELALCQRYCYVTPYGGNSASTAGSEETVQGCNAYAVDDNNARFLITFPQPMRSTPSYTGSNTNAKVRTKNTSTNFNLSTAPSSILMKTASNIRSMNFTVGGLTSFANSSSGTIEFNEAGGFMKFESEI
tara:strand:+ start:37 stop:1236 length:1200 start_codon:yes stop_codon:yes gene_type:complete